MTKRPRRSPEQWLALIEQQQSSDLSISDFCQQQGIGSASFYKWKQRWSEQSHDNQSHQADGFIDLSQLSHPTFGTWNIVLHLGNGMTPPNAASSNKRL